MRVNAVTPGLIDTPRLHTAYGPERDTIVQNRAAILPGKRVGSADEVAQVILMLMTDDDLTGEVVPSLLPSTGTIATRPKLTTRTSTSAQGGGGR